MTDLKELLGKVRRLRVECDENGLLRPGYREGFQYGCSAGVNVVCDKLIPALEEALSALETHCTGFAGCDAHRSISKIRSILEGAK